MKSKTAIYIAGAFLVIIVGLILVSQLTGKQYRFYGTLIDPPVEAYDFSLTHADGSVFRLSDQKGKVVLLFFGYTHCPDVCPTTLADYKAMAAELGDKADQVAFVYITVDPQRDTPEIIARYARAFNPAFIGLSGTDTELDPIYERYGVFHEIQDVQTADNYLVSHTSVIYVIDKQGDWRLTFPFELGPYEMVADVEYLLSE
jgi:protein SCO1/2